MNNEEQTRRIEQDIRHITDRFDRHLEIYAQNGKELAALKKEVESFHSLIEAKLSPMRKVLYGAVGIILTAFMGNIIMNQYTKENTQEQVSSVIRAELQSAIQELEK